MGFNRLDIIRELLAAHADVEKTDRMGNTPLHYAAGAACTRLWPCSSSVPSSANNSPTSSPCCSSRHPHCVVVWAPVYATDAEGRSHEAAWKQADAMDPPCC